MKPKLKVGELNSKQIFGDLAVIRSEVGGFEIWHRFKEERLVWFNRKSISALRDLLNRWDGDPR